jgi:hypothetical protein
MIRTATFLILGTVLAFSQDHQTMVNGYGDHVMDSLMRKHLWGMFSGGYVTVLAAIFVVMLRMTFIEAMATTKLINVFLSGIATLRGAVNYRLGTIRCSPQALTLRVG